MLHLASRPSVQRAIKPVVVEVLDAVIGSGKSSRALAASMPSRVLVETPYGWGAGARAYSTTTARLSPRDPVTDRPSRASKAEVVVYLRDATEGSRFSQDATERILEVIDKEAVRKQDMMIADSKIPRPKISDAGEPRPVLSGAAVEVDFFEQGREATDKAYKYFYGIASSLVPELEAVARAHTEEGSLHCIYLAFQNLHDNFWDHLPGVLTEVFTDKSKEEVDAIRPKGDNIEFGRLAVAEQLRGTSVVEDTIKRPLVTAMSNAGTPRVVCVLAENVGRKLIRKGFIIDYLTPPIHEELKHHPEKESVLRDLLKEKLGFTDKYVDRFINKYLKPMRVRTTVITCPSLHRKLHGTKYRPANLAELRAARAAAGVAAESGGKKESDSEQEMLLKIIEQTAAPASSRVTDAPVSEDQVHVELTEEPAATSSEPREPEESASRPTSLFSAIYKAVKEYLEGS
jgi:hypothetical protein